MVRTVNNERCKICDRFAGNQEDHPGLVILNDACQFNGISLLGTVPPYLCSKSTGAVTSCTRKYFASAGYFLATASYIAYATLR